MVLTFTIVDKKNDANSRFNTIEELLAYKLTIISIAISTLFSQWEPYKDMKHNIVTTPKLTLF